MKLVIGAESKEPRYYRKGMTTDKVGRILEEKYGLFTKFANMQGHLIIDAIYELQLAKLNGHPVVKKRNMPGYKRQYDTLPKVERKLRSMIRNQEFNALLPGVPTKAALEGRNSKKRIWKGPPRPSFIDGGALIKNLRVWVKP